MDKSRLLSWHILVLFLTVIDFMGGTEMAAIRRRRTEFDLRRTAWELAFGRLVSRVDVLDVLRIVLSRLEHNFWITTGLIASTGLPVMYFRDVALEATL